MREMGAFSKVAIFVYFVAKGIYYCKAKWPIFGLNFMMPKARKSKLDPVLIYNITSLVCSQI